MANAAGIVDPFVVKYDAGNGIATNGDDARFSIGGLTQGVPGSSFGYDTGVYPSSFDSSGITDLRVSAQVSPNMTVNVLAGNYVTGRSSHGAYWGCLTSAQTVTIASNGSGNPRYDVVVVRNRDGGIAGDGTVTQSAFMYVIQGTPAASPVEPSITDGDVPLARILVRAGTSSIISTDVTDRRVYETAKGGITPVSSSDTRGGGYPGQYRDNASALERYDGTSWVAVATPAQWSSFTPVLYNGGTYPTAGSTVSNLGTGASTNCRYQVTGKKLELSYTFNWGTTGFNMGVGAITTTLPPGLIHRATGGESHIMAKLFVNDSASGTTSNWVGNAFCRQNENVVWMEFPYSTTNCSVAAYTVSNPAATPGSGIPLIPSGYPQGGILTITGTIEIQ